MSHTPGPWTVEKERTARSVEWRIVAVTPEGRRHRLAVVANHDMPSHGLAGEDDARLIASAPDLLAACKRLLVLIRAGGTVANIGDGVSFAEDAIRKAEGGAS
ncbi:MAG: hypothetical protein LC745_07425 [Planctomycetia bacterium]|nr:hypothetical protein [Planctomycetia bacterium]